MNSCINKKINMNKLYFISFFFFSVLSANLSAQFTNILIDNGGHAEEPSIAINPLNTNEVVAGSNTVNNYYSTDGGATWTKNIIFSNYGNAGDPCVVADS